MEKECLEFCLSLSDDPEFQEEIKKATHEERVVFLLDNGFEFKTNNTTSSQLPSDTAADVPS